MVKAKYALVTATFESTDLEEFANLAGDYDYWYKNEREMVIDYLKEDEDWDDLDEDAKERRISSEIKEAENDADTTTIFFRNPVELAKGTWVIHYTKADPLKVINNFDGCGPNSLGLTRHHGCSPGDLAFGLRLKDNKGRYKTFYGDNALLLKVDEAVLVEHISDEDTYQTVFSIDSIKDAFLFVQQGNTFDVYDRSGKRLGEVKKEEGVFDNFLKRKRIKAEAKSKVSWIMPKWDDEKDEFVLYSNAASLAEWRSLLQSVKRLSPLTEEIWAKLDNTDSFDIKSLGEARKLAARYGKDIASIEKAFEEGSDLPAPIIIRWEDGDSYSLVAGNTRLMVSRALKIQPQVVILDLTGAS